MKKSQLNSARQLPHTRLAWILQIAEDSIPRPLEIVHPLGISLLDTLSLRLLSLVATDVCEVFPVCENPAVITLNYSIDQRLRHSLVVRTIRP